MVAEYQVVPRAARVSSRRVSAVPGTHGQWLVLQRQARGWSVAQMVRKLRDAAASAGDRLPGRDSLIVMIHRWENNRSGISERYRLHVRHEAHCYIARGAGREWRRCLWI